MARKLKTMTLVIRCTVADNQLSAAVDSISTEVNVEDTPVSGEAAVFPGTDAPAWDGAKTGTTIVSDCLALLKTKYGT